MSIVASLGGPMTAAVPARRTPFRDLARSRLSGAILIAVLLLLWEVSAARG